MRDPCWTKETVDDVCRRTLLSENQVYKWGWDQKKKRGRTDNAFYPSTDEFGGYSKHGFNQIDSLAASIGINLDQKVKELDIDFIDTLCAPHKSKSIPPKPIVFKPQAATFEIDDELEEILKTPRRRPRSNGSGKGTGTKASKPGNASESSNRLSSVNTAKL